MTLLSFSLESPGSSQKSVEYRVYCLHCAGPVNASFGPFFPRVHWSAKSGAAAAAAARHSATDVIHCHWCAQLALGGTGWR